MKITLRSGRIVDTPNIRFSSNRKIINDSKKADKWMIDLAKEEYPDCWKNSIICLFLEGMIPGKLTPAEHDMLFDLLLPDGASQYIFEVIKE